MHVYLLLDSVAESLKEAVRLAVNVKHEPVVEEAERKPCCSQIESQDIPSKSPTAQGPCSKKKVPFATRIEMAVAKQKRAASPASSNGEGTSTWQVEEVPLTNIKGASARRQREEVLTGNGREPSLNGSKEATAQLGKDTPADEKERVATDQPREVILNGTEKVTSAGKIYIHFF